MRFNYLEDKNPILHIDILKIILIESIIHYKDTYLNYNQSYYYVHNDSSNNTTH